MLPFRRELPWNHLLQTSFSPNVGDPKHFLLGHKALGVSKASGKASGQ